MSYENLKAQAQEAIDALDGWDLREGHDFIGRPYLVVYRPGDDLGTTLMALSEIPAASA